MTDMTNINRDTSATLRQTINWVGESTASRFEAATYRAVRAAVRDLKRTLMNDEKFKKTLGEKAETFSALVRQYAERMERSATDELQIVPFGAEELDELVSACLNERLVLNVTLHHPGHHAKEDVTVTATLEAIVAIYDGSVTHEVYDETRHSQVWSTHREVETDPYRRHIDNGYNLALNKLLERGSLGIVSAGRPVSEIGRASKRLRNERRTHENPYLYASHLSKTLCRGEDGVMNENETETTPYRCDVELTRVPSDGRMLVKAELTVWQRLVNESHVVKTDK